MSFHLKLPNNVCVGFRTSFHPIRTPFDFLRQHHQPICPTQTGDSTRSLPASAVCPRPLLSNADDDAMEFDAGIQPHSVIQLLYTKAVSGVHTERDLAHLDSHAWKLARAMASQLPERRHDKYMECNQSRCRIPWKREHGLAAGI